MLSDTFKTILERTILDQFAKAEQRHGISIPSEDKNFLISMMPTMIEKHITKFVNGAVEHHDSPFLSMSPDDMIRAAIEESSDLPNYLYGYFKSKASRSAAGK